MKKMILIAIIAATTVCQVHAKQPQNVFENRIKTDFNAIMNSSAREQKMSQQRLDRSWPYFSSYQKKDILLHMYEEGALSEDDIVNWDLNQIPQFTIGG